MSKNRFISCRCQILNRKGSEGLIRIYIYKELGMEEVKSRRSRNRNQIQCITSWDTWLHPTDSHAVILFLSLVRLRDGNQLGSWFDWFLLKTKRTALKIDVAMWNYWDASSSVQPRSEDKWRHQTGMVGTVARMGENRVSKRSFERWSIRRMTVN
jgi:hypothetical protein